MLTKRALENDIHVGVLTVRIKKGKKGGRGKREQRSITWNLKIPQYHPEPEGEGELEI